jgi:hypothetical protein
MSKQGKASTPVVPETIVKSQSGATNTKEKSMSEENKAIEVAEWPKGLYMIFLKTDTDAYMGKVIGLTPTTALIHPWDFMFGGVDEEVVREIVVADFKQFIPFDDVWKMDDYFSANHWKLITGETK